MQIAMDAKRFHRGPYAGAGVALLCVALLGYSERNIFKRYTTNTLGHTCIQHGGFDGNIAAARVFESLPDRWRGNLFAVLVGRLDMQQAQIRSVALRQSASGFAIQLYRAKG
jgi:hypothetical protein